MKKICSIACIVVALIGLIIGLNLSSIKEEGHTLHSILSIIYEPISYGGRFFIRIREVILSIPFFLLLLGCVCIILYCGFMDSPIVVLAAMICFLLATFLFIHAGTIVSLVYYKKFSVFKAGIGSIIAAAFSMISAALAFAVMKADA